MVVCPSLSPFTMMKITTYGGRHLSHIQPFLSLSRVLFRARTFCFSTRYPCRTESHPPLTFKYAGRKCFPLRGEWRTSAERGKAFPFGESGAQAPREVTKLHDRKFLLNNFQAQKKSPIFSYRRLDIYHDIIP